MEPIRSKARPRLAESSLCIEIQAKLASTIPCTPEFIEQAIAWADRHVSVLDRIDEFDTSRERSSTTESVVVTAWLIARDGTNDLIRERGDWCHRLYKSVCGQRRAELHDAEWFVDEPSGHRIRRPDPTPI